MDIINVAILAGKYAFMAIGVATVALNFIAPLTKNKTDDKILEITKKILAIFSLNVKDKTLNINSNQLEISIKTK